MHFITIDISMSRASWTYIHGIIYSITEYHDKQYIKKERKNGEII
jgi:hypothetical protein